MIEGAVSTTLDASVNLILVGMDAREELALIGADAHEVEVAIDIDAEFNGEVRTRRGERTMKIVHAVRGLKLIGSSGPRYPKEEFARRAAAIYAKIKDHVDPGNDGKFLAIDIETGEYEIDASNVAAVDRLYERLPDPQIFTYRIGYRAVIGLAGPPKRIAS